MVQSEQDRDAMKKQHDVWRPRPRAPKPDAASNTARAMPVLDGIIRMCQRLSSELRSTFSRCL